MQTTDNQARLFFFLGPHFGVLFLKKIIHYFNSSNYKVVTYSEESDSYYGYENVIDYCKINNIDFLDTSTNKREVLNLFTQFNPTIILCGYYAKILPIEILKLAQDGAYNIHPGKLPNYRGPFPTAWALINNEQEIGITIHEMDSRIDTGHIVAQKVYTILQDETGYELYRRSMELSAEYLFSFMPDILKKNYEPIDQVTIGMGSYYGKIDSHYHIDWKDNTKRIRNLVRVHSKPYFPAYTFLKNKMLLVNRCNPITNQATKLQGPGRILDVTPDSTFYVSCGDGIIEVADYDLCPLNNNSRKEEFIKKGLQLF
ncbi:MAG: hypothetical protein KKD92_16165 [Proteobacteria bacterium]|nr:hypothetical protein [Pseudomonadota bacterium]